MKTNCLRWKKVRRIALLALFLTAIGIEKSLALEFVINGLRYTTTSSTTVKVGKDIYSNAPTGALVIPSTVTYNNVTYTVNQIGVSAFYQCTGLTSVSLPNTITIISESAFLGCTHIAGAFVIPPAVTVIGDFAFKNCSSLTQIVMNNVISVFCEGAFQGCTGLSGDLVFPNTVTKIGGHAFENCSGYHGSLVLSDNINEIGNNAFTNCNFTGGLVLPNGLTAIGNASFQNCSGFSGDLIIPSSVKKIDSNAFGNCTGFRGILMIPTSVEYIYGLALQNCKFSSIYCSRETPPATGNQTFSGVSLNTPIYVPSGSVSAYQNANNWKNFYHIYGEYFFVGKTNDNWSVSTNWSGNAIPQSGGSAVIASNCKVNTMVNLNSLMINKTVVMNVMPGNTLVVDNVVNRGSCENLVVSEGAQLKVYNTNVEAKVKKSISAYSQAQNVNNGWYLISYPMANNGTFDMQENLLTNEYDLYYYDEPTHYWINQENPSAGFNELVAGKGYLYANDHNITIGFTGEVKKSSDQVVIPLDYTEGINLAGFNLIGNPFTYNVTYYQGVNIEENCYRMNEDGSDFIVGQVSTEDPLKPAEGVFVKAVGQNASVIFNPQKLNKVPASNYVSFEIVENGKIADRLYVKRGEGNNMEKLSISGSTTKLYAMENDEKQSVIYCNSDEQPIKFMPSEDGIYIINADVRSNAIDYLHLIDNIKGMDIDLLASPRYSFKASATDTPDRFTLLFAPRPETGDDDAVMGCFAYVENDGVLITDANGGTLEVIDMLGHIIRTKSVFGNDKINLSSGVYVLRLINGNEVKTQKIIIR